MDISSGTEREVGNHRTVVAGGLLGQPRRANAKVIELQIFSRDAKVTHARTTGQESVPTAVCRQVCRRAGEPRARWMRPTDFLTSRGICSGFHLANSNDSIEGFSGSLFHGAVV
jgi:hypothetical protein